MKLDLEPNEVQLVVDTLSERPWRLVEPLIHKIIGQMQMQLPETVKPLAIVKKEGD